MRTRSGLSWWGALVALVAACGGPSTGKPTVEVDAGVTPAATLPSVPSDVTVSEAPIDFGLADCGGTPPAEKTIKIVNAGGGTVAWTAELEADGFAIIGATTGVFSGGGSVSVRVKAKPIPATATAGQEFRATLLIVLDRTKIFRVPIRIAAQGGTLAVMPGDAVFGDTPTNTQAPDLPLEIKNVGNKAVTVTPADPPLTDFKIAYTGGPAGVVVAPGETVPGSVARFRPSRLKLQSTQAPITVTGPVCGTSAKSIKMSGVGTGGVVGFSPGQLDFGKVDCGTKGNEKTIFLYNDGNAAFNWTATLGNAASSSFTLSAAGGVVLPGGNVQFNVVPKLVPAVSPVTDNLYGDILTIATNANGDTPHDIPLLMTARGAILAFTTAPTPYGVRDLFGAALGKPVAVSNTGNAKATVKLTSSTAAYVPNPAVNTDIVAGDTLNGNVNFAPIDFGDNLANLSLSTSDVLCQPLPAQLALSGQGKGVATHVAVGSVGRNSEESASGCAVLTGGHIACWGDNKYGQLGLGAGAPTSSSVPAVIPNFAGAVAVSSGGDFNCARTSAGTVYCWGANRTPENRSNRMTGALGSSGANSSSPKLVAGVSNVISLSAAERHACVVSATVAGGNNGKVFCWGTNRRGNLGTGTVTDSSVIPVAVLGIADAVSVSASGFGGCARRLTNTVSCWGTNNSHGNLGNGTTSGNPTGAPVTVAGLSTSTAIAAGGYGGRSGISCSAITGGGVVCWGDNTFPQNRFSGDTGKITGVPGSGVRFTASATVSTPVAIPGVAGATMVATGQRHMCALVAGGAVQCWGIGANGELGNGTNTVVSQAVNVTGLSNITQISASGGATCAVSSTGVVSCWGSNNFGQLGNPLAVGNVPTVITGF